MFPSLVYLQDSEVIIDGIKFYGAPWIPTNKSGKAFSYLRNARLLNYIGQRYQMIQMFLLTHGPAYNKLDKIMRPIRADQTKLNLGCPQLAERIKAINPQLHICGHIIQVKEYLI